MSIRRLLRIAFMVGSLAMWVQRRRHAKSGEKAGDGNGRIHVPTAQPAID